MFSELKPSKVLLAVLILVTVQISHPVKAYDFEKSLTNYWQGDTIANTYPFNEKNGGIDLSPRTFRTNELNYYSFILKDFKDVIISPFEWRANDWMKVGILAAGTGLLIVFDDHIYDFIQDQKTPFTRFITKFPLEPFGHYAGYSALAGMYAYGHFAKKGRPQATALLATESYLIASLIVRLPKFVFGRTRPDGASPADPWDWQGPGGGSSFWSGHTTAAFALAGTIGEMYKDKLGVQITVYSLATLAGISRIHDKKHWASDVLVGAVVGTVIGKLVVKNYKSRALKLMPLVTPEQQSLKISYTF